MAGPIPPPIALQSKLDEDEFTSFVRETRLTHPSSPSSNVAVWTQDRLELLKTTVATGLTDNEFMLFVEVCKRRQLDPFCRQIYAVKRGGRMTIQTGIDGFRLIAERSGKYLGQTPPMWCGKDGLWKDVWLGPGNPFAAKVGVHKAGQIEPTWAIGYWDTYTAPGPFWQKSGASQLAKCVEALALRKAFPEELSGLYTGDEMQQADDTSVVNVNAVAVDRPQPVLIFPESNDGYGIIKDSSGLEWLISDSAGQLPPINKAITDNTSLLVYFEVDTGRRVITKIEE